MSHETLVKTAQALAEAGGVVSAAARQLGLNRKTFSSRLKRAEEAGLVAKDGDQFVVRPVIADTVAPIEQLPDDDISTDEMIKLMVRRYKKRAEHAHAKLWRKFTVPTDGVYALMLFGDPHVDDNGCNWELLERHCALARETPGLYAVNIGDTTNNWAGRLSALWAEQDTSASTARKLAKWLLCDSGVRWFLWLHGNHDAWQGPVNSALLEGFRPHFVTMEDWQAKVTLCAPNGHEVRLWFAHNFKGHSQWNKLHGPQKAAQMEDWAHIYAAGHHHNWALHQEEHDHRRFVYWLARVRGYKHLDHYANVHGFGQQHHGSSVLAVVDPRADKLSAVQCFADPEEGVEYLKWRRARK